MHAAGAGEVRPWLANGAPSSIRTVSKPLLRPLPADRQCAIADGHRDQPCPDPTDPAADGSGFKERIGGGGEGKVDRRQDRTRARLDRGDRVYYRCYTTRSILKTQRGLAYEGAMERVMDRNILDDLLGVYFLRACFNEIWHLERQSHMPSN